MRSTSFSGTDDSRALCCSFSETRMPSISTSVFWSLVTPKPRRSMVSSLVPVRLERVCTPPRRRSASKTVMAPLFWISSAVMTVVPTGAPGL